MALKVPICADLEYWRGTIVLNNCLAVKVRYRIVFIAFVNKV